MDNQRKPLYNQRFSRILRIKPSDPDYADILAQNNQTTIDVSELTYDRSNGYGFNVGYGSGLNTSSGRGFDDNSGFGCGSGSGTNSWNNWGFGDGSGSGNGSLTTNDGYGEGCELTDVSSSLSNLTNLPDS